VFNISGERFVTFDGLAKACAKAMGAPEPELVHFNPKQFDFGKKKARGARARGVAQRIAAQRMRPGRLTLHGSRRARRGGRRRGRGRRREPAGLHPLAPVPQTPTQPAPTPLPNPNSTPTHPEPGPHPPQAFPMRDQHFFASVDKAQELLGWTPQYGLVDGLKVGARACVWVGARAVGLVGGGGGVRAPRLGLGGLGLLRLGLAQASALPF
jgi:hypothetical protein